MFFNHTYFLPLKTFYTTFLVGMLFLLVTVAGCNKRSDTLLKLDHIDAIIQAHPDSALALLNEINHSGLREGEEKAKYGLLLTMAEDKNYLDPMNDSIILYASEYFTGKGDMLNRIRSDYYRGRVLYHREDFPSALISYFKAKDAAEKANEYFWEGMSYRGISDVYLKVSASADELHYAKKEYESFKKSGVQPYLNYALADLARAYNNNKERIKTIELSEQLIDSAKLYDDPNLKSTALQLKSHNLFWLEKFEEALPLLKEIYESGYAINTDSLYYCFALLKLKDYGKANELIQEISDENSLFKEYIRYQMYKEKGDFQNALEELEIYRNKDNQLIREKSQINLSSHLNTYYELENELKERQIKINRYKTALIIIISLLSLIICLFLIAYIIKKHKHEITAKINFLEQLEGIIQETETENKKSKQIIRSLFGSQFHIIEKSCEILYRNSDTAKANKQVNEYIAKLVDALSIDGKWYCEIEKQIDETYDNLMSDLKTHIPNINKLDYSIYIFSVIGFPSDIIAYLLKLDKVETVYNRKRHLKDKLKKLDPHISKRYLEIFKS